MISSITYKLLAVSKVRGIGKKTLLSLSADKLFYETPLEALHLEFPELSSIAPTTASYSQMRKSVDADVYLAEKNGDHILCLKDSLYPQLLLSTKDRPLLLFVRGNPNRFSDKAVAVVGTREPSPHGQLTCERITNYFANRKWQIVSGLAVGLDTVAHKAALDSNGSTVAVLAHGLDSIYPRQNQKLSEEIVNRDGLLVSEYSYGTPSFPSHFVERDRIQAGLSRGVVMVQSDETGGSWHASRAAVSYGRYLMIPRPTEFDLASGYPKCRGNKYLIESSSDERAKFLKCDSSQLQQLIIVSSREDYPSLETNLLDFADQKKVVGVRSAAIKAA